MSRRSREAKAERIHGKARTPHSAKPEACIAISRWLSEATPPESRPIKPSIPEGWQRVRPVAAILCFNAVIPPGWIPFSTRTGGVASLNHRLLAGKPPACRGARE